MISDQKFLQPLLSALAVVPRRLARDEVRIDLVREDVEGIKRLGLDDRHIVRRHHRSARDVRARAPADIRRAVLDHFANQSDKLVFVHIVHELEGVAAAYEYAIRARDFLRGVFSVMDADDI